MPFLILFVVFAIWAVRRTFFLPTTDRHVAAFAAVYDVPITEANVDVLRATLHRSRRFRLAAGLGALALGAVLFDARGLSVFGYVAGGFAAGSLADELTRRRAEVHRRAASLERRTVHTFVRWWVLAVVALGASAVGAQVVSALLLTPGGGWFVYAPNQQSQLVGAVPDERTIIALAAVAVVVFTLGALLLRRLAQAPTDPEAPAKAAAHHAIRTASIVSVAGAMMLVLGVIAVRLGSATTLHDGAESAALRWMNNITYLAGLVIMLVGANLSLRAFPRTIWFRRFPELPSAVSPTPEPS